ncbi:tol-pal system-associated acyl-CoA thioesterase [Amylibacter sp. IMCC11727]|uniref:tol-pal system-associated acyl-CoA thioesterase n=1 Tax=Amylibacter sp. IMCC11727 TaxID=3039851 RepID=UPI00244E25AC|nr:tol-pal system-associated acyl-CoA thioesterase [Amylibacter sp. IMCC11727]WGI22834.1 tol-pal system-associated acyl-CoA thioesterase [Amylibacter sp. IMCC11727]
MRHEFHVRVYYEDTDLAGIVYYANYLKFIERARSTMVREAGIDQNSMKEGDGLVFAVRHVDATYLKPAKMDDELRIATKLQQLSGAQLLFEQDVFRGDEMLFSSKITVICMNGAGRVIRLPAEIRAQLAL